MNNAIDEIIIPAVDKPLPVLVSFTFFFKLGRCHSFNLFKGGTEMPLAGKAYLARYVVDIHVGICK